MASPLIYPILILVTFLCWWRAFNLHWSVSLTLQPKDTESAPNPSFGAPPLWQRRFSTMTDDPKRGSLGESPSNIFYFIHISDLHVSRFHAVGGKAHLSYFIRRTLPQHAPSFVVVTGDLTDAKDEPQVSGVQEEEEWSMYRGLLSEAGLLSRRQGHFWRDLRGNHDCFSVPSWSSKSNQFSRYSASGSAAWAAVERTSYGDYSFVAVDACPDLGTSRFLNFFGLLQSEATTRLALTTDKLAVTSNHTFLLSHYPASTTRFAQSLDGRNLNDIARTGFSVGLCGHLHKLFGGMGDHLQAYHPEGGWLELEIPDLKLTATYRIIAVDHDMISYVDAYLPAPHLPIPNPDIQDRVFDLEEEVEIVESAHAGENERGAPVVLITNPKDARYIIPTKEPTWRIGQSTHLRVLIWTAPGTVVGETRIWVDGKEWAEGGLRYTGKGDREALWAEGQVKSKRQGPRPVPVATNADENERIFDTRSEEHDQYVPLWTAPWSPEVYADGKAHTLRVEVVDSRGVVATEEVVFRVDGQREELVNGVSGWIMTTDFNANVPAAFIVLYMIIMGSLIYGRIRFEHHGDPTARRPEVERALARPALQDRGRLALWAIQYPLSLFRLYSHRLESVAASGWVFWLMYGYGLAFVSLPWYGGDLFEKQGPSFTWVYLVGISVDGRWETLLDTWFQGFLNLFLFWTPVAWCVIARAGDVSASWVQGWGARLWLGWVVALHALWITRVILTIGYMGLLTGAVGVWWWVGELSLVWWAAWRKDEGRVQVIKEE